jgi:hypothetical protein
VNVTSSLIDKSKKSSSNENVYVNVTSSLCDKSKKSSSNENVYVNMLHQVLVINRRRV